MEGRRTAPSPSAQGSSGCQSLKRGCEEEREAEELAEAAAQEDDEPAAVFPRLYPCKQEDVKRRFDQALPDHNGEQLPGRDVAGSLGSLWLRGPPGAHKTRGRGAGLVPQGHVVIAA